ASPDGRYVGFVSDRAGALNLWRMNVDGSNAIQLTSSSGVEAPYLSPDGKWVFYWAFGHGTLSLSRVPTQGGTSIQRPRKAAWPPVVSPDGRLIACFYAVDETQVKLAVIPFDGGPPLKIFDIPSQVPIVRWTADGDAMTYVMDR